MTAPGAMRRLSTSASGPCLVSKPPGCFGKPLQSSPRACRQPAPSHGVAARQRSARGSSYGWLVDDVVIQANVSAGRRSLSGYALRTGEPAVCHDPGIETRFEIPFALRERGVVNIIAVPIWGKRAHYGTLVAWNTEPRTIATDDVHFVRAVATTVAAALQRRQSEEHGQRLALHDPLTGRPIVHSFVISTHRR